MKEYIVETKETDQGLKATKPCPHHKGYARYAKIGGKYCTRDCEFYAGYDPMTNILRCSKL